ncbi:hypothetical protein QA612_20905 [Evansella sp. AB-P1]|uniref:hypothetical protein n=1 Tax=Evansella sp. AB-P1 TaxID=3037653 RepID=UPI00241E1589|nr:hypothetical protein [Evansella sp. AB-P1]MDG5789920.1 hypothetical protein [Evansella sp. AB-P1]
MKKMSRARFVSVGSMLTAIAVIFQSAPVFLPVVGFAFSPLSTLPIALAAFLNISLGIVVYVATAFILTFIYIQEAIILIFTTGLLGLTIGIFLYRKGLFASIFFSSILLSLGMLMLTYFVGIAVFGTMTPLARIPLTLLIFYFFSLIYASIWSIYLKKIINNLIRIKAFGNILSKVS